MKSSSGFHTWVNKSKDMINRSSSRLWWPSFWPAPSDNMYTSNPNEEMFEESLLSGISVVLLNRFPPYQDSLAAL